MKFRSNLMDPNSDHPDLKSIAKSIYDNTSYRLVNSRLIMPENFHHPLNSLEAKKSLVISLTPMLTGAEEQRKKDTEECENFTRCKSVKCRSGRSSYVYIDVDTNTKVDYSEYESR